MIRRNRLRWLSAAGCALVVAIACSDSPTDSTPPVVASITLSPAADTLESLWISVDVQAAARDSDGNEIPDPVLSWTSSDTSVVWVDSGGRVTAVSNGGATIVAAANGASDSCQVTVEQAIVYIHLYDDTAWFSDTLELTALDEWFRAGATARDAMENVVENAVFSWSSSDTTVATVDSTGLVTAKGNGTTELSATTHDITATKMLAVRAGVRLLWDYHAWWEVTSSPALGANGTVYVATATYGSLQAIEPGGSRRWMISTDRGGSSSPALAADGTVYVAVGDLYAINPDGSETWRSASSANRWSSPAVATDGTVYSVSYDRVVHAIRPDGTAMWQLDLRVNPYTDMGSSPAIAADGTIYVGSGDSVLYAINADGSLKWRFAVADEVWSSPAIDSDGTVYFGVGDGRLHAVNPDGTEKWSAMLGGAIWRSPAIAADGTIYVGSSDGVLYAIDRDGSERWQFATGSRVTGNAAIAADGTVYFGAGDGWFFAVNPDGTLSWKFKTRRTSTPYKRSASRVWSCPAIGDDGTIYVCTRLYHCYALAELAGSNGGLANSPWPKFRHDNRNTGNVATP